VTDKPKTFEEWRKGKMVDAIGEAYAYRAAAGAPEEMK
jgi:hypothetical protein